MSPKILRHSYNIVKTIFRNFKHFSNNVWSQIRVCLWFTKPQAFPRRGNGSGATFHKRRQTTILARDLSNLGSDLSNHTPWEQGLSVRMSRQSILLPKPTVPTCLNHLFWCFNILSGYLNCQLVHLNCMCGPSYVICVAV